MVRVMRDLAGNSVRAAGIFLNVTLEANKGADKDEGGRNEAPKGYECDESAERHGAAALARPQHRVDDEEDEEEHAGHGERDSHCNLKLRALFELLAKTSSDVSSDDTCGPSVTVRGKEKGGIMMKRGLPLRAKKTTMAVRRDPRLEGDKKPSEANARVRDTRRKNWAPAP